MQGNEQVIGLLNEVLTAYLDGQLGEAHYLAQQIRG